MSTDIENYTVPILLHDMYIYNNLIIIYTVVLHTVAKLANGSKYTTYCTLGNLCKEYNIAIFVTAQCTTYSISELLLQCNIGYEVLLSLGNHCYTYTIGLYPQIDLLLRRVWHTVSAERYVRAGERGQVWWRNVFKYYLIMYMYVLLHDNVSEGVPEGVVFLVEYECHTCCIIRIVQGYLRW